MVSEIQPLNFYFRKFVSPILASVLLPATPSWFHRVRQLVLVSRKRKLLKMRVLLLLRYKVDHLQIIIKDPG